jgi:uncharacterized protein (TIGR02271 family)
MSQTPEFNQNHQVAQSSVDTQTSGESVVIPVIDEQVRIGKQVIETGKVLVSKKVHAEEMSVDIPLVHEEHDIERVTINRYVEERPEVRYEGDTMIVPVLREEEVIVVEKRMMLVEEVRITKRQVETSVNQHITLRKEEVTVERVDSSGTTIHPETGINIKPKEQTNQVQTD